MSTDDGQAKNEEKKQVSSPRICRYGQGCRRNDTCRFLHPTTAATNSSGNECRHGINCWSKNCTRTHPTGWNPRNKNINTPDKKKSNAGRKKKHDTPKHDTQDNELEKGYYMGPLREVDSKGYKAAGILLLRRCPELESDSFYQARATEESSSGYQVLLCAEKRKKKGGLELSLLGGKVETDDHQDSKITAAREFWEETGRIASLGDCQELLGVNQLCSIWCGAGKYVLYAVNQEASRGNNEQWDALPQKYHDLAQSGNKPPGAEPEYLVWVDWDLIRQSSSPKGKSKRLEITFSVPATDEPSSSSADVSLEFSFFTLSILSNSVVRMGVESLFESIPDNPQANATESITTGEPENSSVVEGLKELTIEGTD